MGDGGDSGSERPPAPEPTHAERARTLTANSNRGVLSTVALDPAGYPFGSVATYAIDDTGRPIVFVSTMAEHTRNATADPRASLIVTEPFPEGSDPLAAGRVTLIGDLLQVAGDERPAVRDQYLAANPASGYYIDFGDFSFWRLEVRSVRYVGGYGRMSWVEAADYATAVADPLAGEAATGILEHMNADHGDSLVLMARVLGGRAGVTEARHDGRGPLRIRPRGDRSGRAGGAAAGFRRPGGGADGCPAGHDPVGGASPRFDSRTDLNQKEEGRHVGGPPLGIMQNRARELLARA